MRPFVIAGHSGEPLAIHPNHIVAASGYEREGTKRITIWTEVTDNDGNPTFDIEGDFTTFMMKWSAAMGDSEDVQDPPAAE